MGKLFPRRLAALGLSALVAGPGCARAAESSATEAAGTLRGIEADGVELAPSTPPRRVLPANAAWVDFVTQLVGPECVVALPAESFGYSRLSAEPGAWATLPSLPSFEAERVLALAPDLVLAHSWQNPETVATLRGAGLAVLVAPVPETWNEVLDTLEILGRALGESGRARALRAELAARANALSARAAPFAHLSAVSYTNLGAGGWTSGAGTTGDVLLGLAGIVNAAARAGLSGDVSADTERLLALAPDVFLVGRPDRSERSAPSAEFLLAEPALAQLEAVRERRIVALPPALFTSASPELLTGAEQLVTALEALAREDETFPPR